MKKFFTTLFLALIPFFVVAQTIVLPFSYDGKKDNFPTGVKGENLGKDYSKAPHLKFDNDKNKTSSLTFSLPTHQGLTLWYNYKEQPGTNGFEGVLHVKTSTDGITFSETAPKILIPKAKNKPERYMVNIPTGVTIIKMEYEKTKGNVAIGGLHIEQGVSIKVTEAGYATFYSDKHVYLPQELKASIVEENGSGIKVKELNNQVIKSQTPVLLQAKAGDYVAEPLETAKGAANTTGNILQGTLTDKEVTATVGQKIYVLNIGSKGVGFYWQKDTDGSKAKISAGHAYLALPFASGGVQGFSLVDPIVTGVEAVETQNTEEDAPIYDLSGRRVTHPTHGIYIIGGKKVMR